MNFDEEPSIDLAMPEPSDVTAVNLDQHLAKMANLDEQDLIAQVHSDDRGYLRFKPAAPGSHLDGRARFLAALGNEQLADDTTKLAKWDDGDYENTGDLSGDESDDESDNGEDFDNPDDEDDDEGGFGPEDMEDMDEEAMIEMMAQMMAGGAAGIEVDQ